MNEGCDVINKLLAVTRDTLFLFQELATCRLCTSIAYMLDEKIVNTDWRNQLQYLSEAEAN